MERIPPDKREEWEFQMNQPLPGEDPKKVTPTQIEDEGAGFMAMMQMQQSLKAGN